MSNLKEASYYQKLENGNVRCQLCPQNCTIAESKTGLCQVRKNIAGKLYSLNFNSISSVGIDPVEKKPLYHFHPHKKVLSVGSWGCNLSCQYCQNWQISQQKPPLKTMESREVVNQALAKNIDLIAYTYSEPTVFYEYMLETAELAAAEGLKNILVSNGLIKEKPLRELLPVLDAANIDLKAFNNKFYQQNCGGELGPVKKTIEILTQNIHLEVTTLIVTDLNDDLKELENLFKWLAEINPEIPLHLSRYHPAYKLDNPATDLELMQAAYYKAKKYLAHVYLGNTIIENTADTYCSSCNKKLIKRQRYQTINKLQKDKCPACGSRLYGEF